MYRCPVCGYEQLQDPPRNYSICPSCGTEFGLDDAKKSHVQLRLEWVMAGGNWFSRARRPPPNWNPWQQLIGAGFTYSLPYSVVIRPEHLTWAEMEIDAGRSLAGQRYVQTA
jgi:hypothetical protein